MLPPVAGETRLTATWGWVPAAAGGVADATAAGLDAWMLGGAVGLSAFRNTTPVPASAPMNSVVTAAAILMRAASFMGMMFGRVDQERLRRR
jgi:hypothetical protein